MPMPPMPPKKYPQTKDFRNKRNVSLNQPVFYVHYINDDEYEVQGNLARYVYENQIIAESLEELFDILQADAAKIFCEELRRITKVHQKYITEGKQVHMGYMEPPEAPPEYDQGDMAVFHNNGHVEILGVPAGEEDFDEIEDEVEEPF